jgi:hypothetical protein
LVHSSNFYGFEPKLKNQIVYKNLELQLIDI